MTGDGGGAYQTVKNNVVYIPGQYGIAASGGTDMLLDSNIVYSVKITT